MQWTNDRCNIALQQFRDKLVVAKGPDPSAAMKIVFDTMEEVLAKFLTFLATTTRRVTGTFIGARCNALPFIGTWAGMPMSIVAWMHGVMQDCVGYPLNYAPGVVHCTALTAYHESCFFFLHRWICGSGYAAMQCGIPGHMCRGTCVICRPAMRGVQIGATMLLPCATCLGNVKGQRWWTGNSPARGCVGVLAAVHMVVDVWVPGWPLAGPRRGVSDQEREGGCVINEGRGAA